MRELSLSKNKKGQSAQIGGLVGGIIGLVFLIVVGFVSLDILTSADLLTENSTFDKSVDGMVNNLSAGVDKVSLKIPIMFTIAVAVLLLGLIVFLVIRARQAQQAQGGTI